MSSLLVLFISVSVIDTEATENSVMKMTLCIQGVMMSVFKLLLIGSLTIVSISIMPFFP